MKTQAEHLKNKGEFCPVCGSDQVEGGFVDVNYDGADQSMLCLNCRASWLNSFKLSGYSGVVHDQMVVDLNVANVTFRTVVLDMPLDVATKELQLDITGCPDSDRLYLEDQLGYRYKRKLPNLPNGLAVFVKM